MFIKTKIKIKRLELKTKETAQKLHKQAQKLALATLATMYLLAIGHYYLVKYDFLPLKSETITVINEVKAKETEPKEDKKPETVQETIQRVAKEENFSDIDTLLNIAKCESDFNRYAKNPKSSARGIFQILDMHKLTEDERYNPEISTRWAIKEIRRAGTGAWNESKQCWTK